METIADRIAEKMRDISGDNYGQVLVDLDEAVDIVRTELASSVRTAEELAVEIERWRSVGGENCGEYDKGIDRAAALVRSRAVVPAPLPDAPFALPIRLNHEGMFHHYEVLASDGMYIFNMQTADALTAQYIVAAINGQLPEPDADATASMQCPICGEDTPHSHSSAEMAVWIDNVASTYGYAAILTDRATRSHRYNDLTDPLRVYQTMKAIVDEMILARDEDNEHDSAKGDAKANNNLVELAAHVSAHMFGLSKHNARKMTRGFEVIAPAVNRQAGDPWTYLPELPLDDNEVWVTLNNGMVTGAFYVASSGLWSYMDGEEIDYYVIAWQPRPEPARGRVGI